MVAFCIGSLSAILAEKFAPDLSWYVDVVLQLIDKAGDFVSDDIWFRVVQFVTNNEDLQPYAALKAREYLDKPAIHETMVKVSAYLLGEYSYLLARRPVAVQRKFLASYTRSFLLYHTYNLHSFNNIRKDLDALTATRSGITKSNPGSIQQIRELHSC
ncbi:hypothetical protein L1887_30421 [Cichorium endivia]|nr:hypothetical protein L1887_30421 [Cichorium endivia]